MDKLVVELETQLEKNEVTIELEPAARDWIAARGYDKKMGARPMARVIQEHIKRPLAEELLFGRLADGGHVRVEVGPDGESLVLTVEPTVRELEHLPDSASTDKADGRAARRPRGERTASDLAEQQDKGSER